MDSTPSWVLLAPVPSRVIEQAVDDGPPGAQWRLVRGTGKYNALVDDELGTERSGERELALQWSSHGRCYVGYFDDPLISVCEAGRWVKEEEGDPWELAASLGCALRDEPAPEPEPSGINFVVADVKPEELARAYRKKWPIPRGDRFHVEAVALGALAYEDDGDVIDLARSVSQALATTVYTVEWLPDEPSFRVERIERGAVTGLYDVPASWWSQEMRMSDVLGEREPIRIMQRLGHTPRNPTRAL